MMITHLLYWHWRSRDYREILHLYSQLYLSLSDQLETAKIDENDKSSSIYTLDSPYISSFKSGIVFHKMILLILLSIFSSLFINYL